MKGFHHSTETKRIISAAASGEGKGGFNVKTRCPDCQREMSPANLGKHAPACEKTKRLTVVFGYRPSTAELKLFEKNLRTYRLTTDGFFILWERQRGACAICRESIVGFQDGRRAVHIDHCHSSGAVRGLLCSKCNLLIGYAGDEQKRLVGAVIYLSIHEEGWGGPRLVAA